MGQTPGVRQRKGPAIAAVLTTVVLAAAGCGGSPNPGAGQPRAAAPTSPAPTSPAQTSPAPSTATPSTATPTTVDPVTAAPATTGAFVPAVPQASATSAAAALVYEWGQQDRARAATVAAPAAVAALFATPPKPLQFRGCSDGAAPITCTYADRSTAAGALYQLNTVQVAGSGWYVASVQVEQ